MPSLRFRLVARLREGSRFWRVGRAALCVGVVALLALSACRPDAPRTDLRDLVVVDSTYYEPGSTLPFTGRVFRPFAGDSTGTEIEGEILEGTWHGELVVYHPSGRIRYMGSFDHGDRCGPWTENRFDEEPEDPYEQLLSEIETLAMYPPCPTDR